MTALSAAIQGGLKMKDGILVERPVKAQGTIYTGSFVAIDTNGYAIPCPANVGAGNAFDGVAVSGTLDKGVIPDNAGASTQNVLVFRKGLFYCKVTGAALNKTNVNVFVTDDNTLTITDPGSGVVVGKHVKYDGETGKGWVEFTNV